MTGAEREALRMRVSEARLRAEHARDMQRLEAEQLAGRLVPKNILWTEERILKAIREWAATHGRQPVAFDWNPASSRHPSFTTVQNRFGSWNAAIELAGFPRRQTGLRRDLCPRLKAAA